MKIAIVRRNGLGDLLCTYPLIYQLKKKYPTAHITLFVEPSNAPLTTYLKGVDEVVVIPKGNKYLQMLRLGLFYRSKNFDLAISAKPSPMRLVSLFLVLLGAKQSIAIENGGWQDYFISRKLPPFPPDMHQALKVMKMVFPEMVSIPTNLFPKIARASKEECSHLELPTKKPTLLLSASTTRFSNRMNAAKYSRIVKTLIEKYHFHPLMIAFPQDGKRAREIIKNINSNYSLLFPRSFDQFMLALSAADFYMIGDSGVAHLGAALHKPQLVWYGESSPKEWSPMGQHIRTLYHPKHVDEIEDSEIINVAEKLIQEVFCD